MEQPGGSKRKSDTDDWNENYSPSEKKKGPRAPWTSQDMVSAMLLVKQGMSITKAAQSLNIPRTTLRDRVTGKVKSVVKIGAHSPLSGHDERSLVAYYKLMRKQGYGKSKKMILYMAGKMTQKNGFLQGEQLPDENWWQSFCARHNQPLYEFEEMHAASKEQENEAKLGNFYPQLLNTLTSNKYDVNFLERPELIYSCNENNFSFEQINEIINSKKNGSRENGDNLNRNESHVTTQAGQFASNQDSTRSSGACSVITCVDALGNFLPPFFIHKTRGSDIQFNVPLEQQASHRLDQDFFLNWFHEVFLKNIRRSTGPCVLIYDGNNCFVTKELLMAAAMKEVIMFCIPASLSHVLQPLDLAIDGTFHESWRNFLTQNCEFGTISHSNFSQMFLAGWRNIVTGSALSDRFQTVGIYPFFRQSAVALGLANEDDNETSNTRNNASKEFSGSDVSTHLQHKDILMRAVDSIGQLDNIPDGNSSFDSNQNNVRPSGIISRPTMSNLNQPLTENPVIAQFIQNEDDYRHEFQDVYHDVNSADDISSASEDGNPTVTALNSMTSVASKVTLEKPQINSPSPTAANNLKKPNHQLSPVTFSSPPHISLYSGPKNPSTSPSSIKHVTVSTPGKEPAYSFSMVNINKNQATPNHRTMPPNTKSLPPLYTVSFPPSRSTGLPRGPPPPWLASLTALEDLLGKRRLQKFQHTLENAFENPVNLDPLYPVWKALKLGYFPGTNNPQGFAGNALRHPNIPKQRDVPGRTTSSLADTNHCNVSPSVTCSCATDNYRTVVTPAGNVSVNRNATVVVIMPEKTEESTGSSESTQFRTNTSRESS